MKKWVLCGMCLISLFVGNKNALAEETSSSSSQLAGGYTIEGVPNEHQLDKNVSYFYLKENPGDKDQVKVKLTNDSSEEKTLEVKVTNANTNANGLIDYTGQLKDHRSLKYPLTSMAKATQKEVKVPAKSSVETAVDIQMPKQTLPGVTIGGITVSEKQSEKKKQNELSIGNVYTYTIGLVVTNESVVEPKKNVSVALDHVGAVLFDGRKMVQADILNPNPYMFTDATVKGKIYEKGATKALKEQEKSNVSIAPYSVYPFQFDWEKEELKAGTYVFKGTVEANGKTWNFDQEFDISAEKAKTINHDAVVKIYIPSWLTYSSYGLSVVSILGTIYLFLRRKK